MGSMDGIDTDEASLASPGPSFLFWPVPNRLALFS